MSLSQIHGGYEQTGMEVAGFGQMGFISVSPNSVKECKMGTVFLIWGNIWPPVVSIMLSLLFELLQS